MPETLLTPIMDDLRACLCAQLEAAGGPACFCGLYPGPVALADWCSCKGRGQGCGQAFVRLDRIYPSANFPNPDPAAATCTTVLAAVLEVGIFRCIPVPRPDGSMDPTAVVQQALQQAEDAMTLFKAAVCCSSITRRDHSIGTWLPVNAGDCGGGTLPVTVRLTR